ncbi:uncharacterized protein LOC126373217 [Pectinophora gossypiella]|uniref:uncharacterized protein LOC126373217 n=1 Tax=Pectinophora gossypiella TaxID=13191 RepID=UPI00214E2BA8|nr:uncharacterized protein LOC126373217 [Pectinophora gossypiella]
MAASLDTSFKQKICESVEIPILTRCCFCFPLRKGLISFAYINLVLTLVVTSFLSLYMAQMRRVDAAGDASDAGAAAEFPRLCADTAGLLLELIMTVSFIVALHKKHVLLMKVYLYFEIVFSVIGFVYSVAFLTRETASELFLILFQLTIQIYLVILIWSSIVKMQRDGSVKYVRDREEA